ncbi:uncharacterized protein LOC120173794 [Hibiscus syriacus]|uniref:uncharacterized protein LOC120173794 n=1 Tax=Hibiscus syriacus TaxID=106335 RepID=UPI001924A33A|nr:uncharacterized protein LOC120173794 [Hibiscus syriacus]
MTSETERLQRRPHLDRGPIILPGIRGVDGGGLVGPVVEAGKSGITGGNSRCILIDSKLEADVSVSKDAAFCFVCYLFKNETTKAAGGDAFFVNGFRGWNRPVRFRKHVGGINSAHNQAIQKFENLKNFKSSLKVSLDQQTEQAKSDYRIRLTTYLHCLRFLLHQGLTFRGHDECDELSNNGNFLELLNWIAEKNDDVGNVVLKNAPKNNQMIAPLIQKELINCCAKETTKVIVEDLGYDGASNMKGELNGLKTLILRETQSAYYIHCFGHQLQLTLIAVSKKNKDCGWLFNTLRDLLNVVGSSCRQKDLLKGKQAEKIAKAFENGEIVTGKGLNHELGYE